MNQISKRLFACIIALALCFHFVWIVVYCLPKTGRKTKVESIGNLYVYPIFQQNWNLFVPAPNVERKLFVRCKVEDQFTYWKDILNDEVVRRKENHFVGNEAKTLLLSNSLIYALNSFDGKPSSIYKEKINSKEFQVLQFEVNQYLMSEYKYKSGTDYEILMVSSEKEKSNAYYIQTLSMN